MTGQQQNQASGVSHWSQISFRKKLGLGLLWLLGLSLVAQSLLYGEIGFGTLSAEVGALRPVVLLIVFGVLASTSQQILHDTIKYSPETETSPRMDSANQLVSQSRGTLQIQDIIETGSLTDTYLFDRPLIEYIQPDEQPEYLFRNDSRGFRITHADGTEETPHHDWNSSWARGHRHLLVTDRRLLYVVGSKDGDEFREFPHDAISDIKGGGSELRFRDTSGTEYKFVAGKNAHEASDAVHYIARKIGKVDPIQDPERGDAQTGERGSTPQSELNCPSCNSPIRNDVSYCPECGVDVTKSCCPDCGAPIEQDPNFCPECGHEMSSINQTTAPDNQEQTLSTATEHETTETEIDTEDSAEQADTETGDTDDDRYYFLSWFAAVMLFWGGAYALTAANRPGDFVLFVLLGGLIIPRVREFVVDYAHRKVNIDLTGSTARIVVWAVYGVTVGSVALLMIGDAENDPEMTATVGVGAIVFAAIVAGVLSYATGTYQDQSTS